MIRNVVLSFVIFFLVNCAAPGTTFEELDQIQIDEAIAIIKNTELDEPVERTRKESVILVEDIIEKNLNCIQFIKTPNDQLPLFNGASSIKLNQIQKYLENGKK